VVKVKLEGLNIVKSRGRWYVYIRETGEKLVSGFVGDKPALVKRLEQPDIIAKYNAPRVRKAKKGWDEGTLGALVQWFETECPEYLSLAEATKKDYSAAFLYLRPEFDIELSDLTQADIYDTRDRCSREKWPRFADKMVSALSSMFSQAVKRKKMTNNPAMGISKGHKADPNANREWSGTELAAAIEAAPPHIKTILYIARYAGFRGQTIATLTWRNYQDDASYGKCFRFTAGKNKEFTWIPASKELQAHLATVDRNSTRIATKADGQPYEKETQMQTEVSHFLRALEAEGKIEPGTTLHGLRVTYAAGLKRDGAETGDVAAALGDRSERMGAHYTRHVENEAKVIRAFAKQKKD
jgi:integrase